MQIEEGIERLLKSEEAEMKSLGARLLQEAMKNEPEEFDEALRRYITWPFRFEYRPGISTNDLMVKVIDYRTEGYGTGGSSGYSGTSGYSTTYTTSATGYYTVNSSGTPYITYGGSNNVVTTGLSYWNDIEPISKPKKTFIQWLKKKLRFLKGLKNS